VKHSEADGDVNFAIAAVRGSIRCLLEPTAESLDRAEVLLREAQARLQATADSPPPSSPEHRMRLRSSVEDLRRALERTSGLLAHAAGFYAGWTRLRNSLAAGYTAGGQPAEVPSGNRLSVEA
jgi:hypothetical protein